MIAVSEGKTIEELHFWGHGTWGQVFIDGRSLGMWAMERTDSPIHLKLAAIASRLEKTSLVWFRTCATFGNMEGMAFAKALVDFLQCRVAAHTHNIGFWHTGLRSLGVGEEPEWESTEGVKQEGQAERAEGSYRKGPNTILFLRSHPPRGW